MSSATAKKSTYYDPLALFIALVVLPCPAKKSTYYDQKLALHARQYEQSILSRCIGNNSFACQNIEWFWFKILVHQGFKVALYTPTGIQTISTVLLPSFCQTLILQKEVYSIGPIPFASLHNSFSKLWAIFWSLVRSFVGPGYFVWLLWPSCLLSCFWEGAAGASFIVLLSSDHKNSW